MRSPGPFQWFLIQGFFSSQLCFHKKSSQAPLLSISTSPAWQPRRVWEALCTHLLWKNRFWFPGDPCPRNDACQICASRIFVHACLMLFVLLLKKNTRPFSSVSTNKETRRTTIPQTRRAHFLLGHFSLWLSLWFLLSTKVRGFLRILRPAKQDMLMPSLSWLEVTCYPGFSKLFSSHKEPSPLKGCKDEEISFSVSVGGA